MTLKQVLGNRGKFYTTVGVDSETTQAVILITDDKRGMIVAHADTGYVGSYITSPDLWDVQEIADVRIVGAIVAKTPFELKSTK